MTGSAFSSSIDLLCTRGLTVLLQSALLIICGLLAGAISHRLGPRIQCLVYRTTLVAVVCTAVGTLSFGSFRTSLWKVSTPIRTTMNEDILNLIFPVNSRAQSANLNVLTPVSAGQSPTETTPAKSSSTPYFGPLALLWGLGTALGLFSIIRGANALSGLRKRARDLTQDAAEELMAVSAALQVKAPALLSSREAVSPMLMGLISPAVVLPYDYQSAFDTPEFRAILLHELTHYARRDLWWSVAARVAGCMLWMQPLMPILSRKLEQAAEESCDEAVLEQNVSPRLYASCLMRLADRLKGKFPHRAHAAGIIGFRSSLGRRVQRIMESRSIHSKSITMKMRAILTSVLAVGTLAALTLVSVRATEQPVSTSQSAQGIKMDRSTPEACIRSFCAALSGQAMRTAIECVAGADSTAISDSFFQEMQSHPIKMAIDSATTTITGNSATCAISGKFLPDGTMTDGKGLFLKETINLTNSGDGWKIVPPKTAKLEEDRVDILVSTIAYLLKNPAVMEHARSQAQGTSCVSNLKQMALCSLMYAQDYKETFPSKSVEIHKALLPYCKNAAIFSCPQTKKAYTFNSAVRGKKLASIKSPATTVLIYEGTDNKLSFVHDGKAGVAFADGHVKLIDAKEAAKYSWTP